MGLVYEWLYQAGGRWGLCAGYFHPFCTHACSRAWELLTEVFPGRMFWLAASVLRLNRGFRSELEWWHRESWNGAPLCAQFDSKCPNVFITSDASGRWSCGAYLEEGDQYKWQEDIVEANITVWGALAHCDGLRTVGQRVGWVHSASTVWQWGSGGRY